MGACGGVGVCSERVAGTAAPARVRHVQAGRPVTAPGVRPARKDESRDVAALFAIASDGIADYVWTSMQGDFPGLSPIEIGQRRYEREDVTFSYQHCLVAEEEGRVLGMVHCYAMEATTPPDAGAEPVDPVLKPYLELEAPGTLYIAGLAVWPEFRGRGVGLHLLETARQRARSLGLRELSLLCYAGNTGARRFYERAGFVVVDWRPVVPHPMIRHTGDVLLMLAPL